MKSWKDVDVGTRHLIILVPVFVILMFINAGVYQAIHNNCESEHDNTVTYIEAFSFLQTVAFTIGYGHISPQCHGGKVYTFIFAYFTIPMVVYILALFGRKIADTIMEKESIYSKMVTNKFGKRLLTITLLDAFILVFMMIIPAGILTAIEPCFNYGESIWYIFQTVTTIGFGDIIAASGYNYECLPEVAEKGDFFHQLNFYWVCKLFFLLLSLSLMAATWILKYQMILDYFYDPMQAKGRKQLIDNDSANAMEAADMNNTSG